MLIYILDEFSYDQFHENPAQLYRVVSDAKIRDTHFEVPATPAPLGPTIEQYYPQIIDFARVSRLERSMLFASNKHFYEDEIYAVDPSFLKMFNFSFLYGDPSTALATTGGIVLSEKTALKYFSSTDVVGQTLVLNDSIDMRIDGVLAKMPRNTHFAFDILIPYKAVISDEQAQTWGSFNDYTYLRLPDGVDNKTFTPVLQQLYMDKMADAFAMFNSSCDFRIQAVTDIHLKSALRGEFKPNGNLSYIQIFGAAAILLLLVAGINYTNLATARSSQRSKEVGVRKALGSYRSQLRVQFLIESLSIAFLAVFISLVLVDLLLPGFNVVTGKSFTLQDGFNLQLISVAFAIMLVIGILAGLYPAAILSSFQPQEVLKGVQFGASRKSTFRGLLVGFRFMVSIVMMIGTWLVFAQLKYLDNADLGFKKENLILVDLRSGNAIDQYEVLKNRLGQYPEILSVGGANGAPGEDDEILSSYRLETPSGMQEQLVKNFSADASFLNTIGATMVAGDPFPTHLGDEAFEGVIVNEAFVKSIGWTEPVGMKVEYGINDDLGALTQAKVTGVVADFHIMSLHEVIEPLLIHYREENGLMLVRLDPENLKAGIKLTANIWDKTVATSPFEYSFVDDTFEQKYETDRRKASVLASFSVLTIIVACLGLFGLSSYSAEQKRKEVGIRKISGASVASIAILFNKQYLRLALISTIVAWPLAYYAIDFWLQNFVYRIDIDFEAFLFAGLAAIGITLVTVSYHTIIAANSDPVNVINRDN